MSIEAPSSLPPKSSSATKSRSRRRSATRRALFTAGAAALGLAGILAALVIVNRDKATQVPNAGSPQTAALGEPSLTTASDTLRRVYRHSVVPGGVFSPAEVRAVVDRDDVVASHYRDLDLTKLTVARVERPRLAYMSYRIGNQVYWTKRMLPLGEGETLITDGETTLRARCGNMISSVPQMPVADDEPRAEEFDALGDPILFAALPDPAVSGPDPGRGPLPGPMGRPNGSIGSPGPGGTRWPIPLGDPTGGDPDPGAGPNPGPERSPDCATPAGGMRTSAVTACAEDPGPNPPGPNPPGPNPPGPNPPGPNPPGPNPPGPNPPGPNPPGPNPPGPNPPGPNPPGPNPPGPNPPGPNPPGPNPPDPNPDPDPDPVPPVKPPTDPPVPVPEPSTLALIGIGAAGGIGRYLKKRRAERQ